MANPPLSTPFAIKMDKPKLINNKNKKQPWRADKMETTRIIPSTIIATPIITRIAGSILLLLYFFKLKVCDGIV